MPDLPPRLTAAISSATDAPVMKAHALSRRGIDERIAKALRQGEVRRPHFYWTSQQISASLRSGGSWNLVCGVREPVSLAVSGHFYGLQRQSEVGVEPAVALDDMDGHSDAIARELRSRFLEMDWFDTELAPLTGIEVYAEPFPRDRGHQTYENGRFRALVLRAEDLPRTGPTAVRSFLGLDQPLAIDRRNGGTSDRADSAYRRFLERGHLSPALVDEVYDTRLARHFYSDEERHAFRLSWTGATV